VFLFWFSKSLYPFLFFSKYWTMPIGPILYWLPQWARCMCMSMNRKYVFEVFMLSYLWALFCYLINAFFDCTCSSHTLRTKGGGWRAFAFQDRYTACLAKISQPAAWCIAGKGMHEFSTVFSFICSQGRGREGKFGGWC